MAYHIGDGFDMYNAIGDGVGIGQAGAWDSASGWIMSTTTRWATGRAVNSNGAGFGMSKGGGTNSSTWFITFAMDQVSGLGGQSAQFMYFDLFDGASVQCTITLEGDGAIRVRNGGNGAVVATWSGAYIGNSFDHYQVQIIIHNTAGEVHIRKNGATSDSFAATGINTRGGTTNNYANGFQMNTNGSGVRSSINIDDLLVYTGDGAAPNTWVGDIRAVMLMPVGDTATKHFTQNSTGSLAFGQSINTGTRAFVAGTLQTTQLLTCTQGGTMASVTVEFNANFTGNAKAALYLADGNLAGSLTDSKPGTLVAVSNQVTNPTTGLNTFTFASTVGVMKGFGYFLALLTDGAATTKATTSTGSCFTFAVPGGYGSGYPLSLSNVTSNPTQTAPTIYAPSGVLTATNAGCVSDEIQDALTTYLSDASLGDKDLYTIQQLPYVPLNVIGLNLKSISQKTDNGARGMKLELVSGGTTVDSTEFNPQNSTFREFATFFATDPNTSAAWSSSAVNAINIGPLVST